MIMVHDKKRTFRYNSFCNGEFSYYFLTQEFTLCTYHPSLRWLELFHDKATDVLA